MNEKKINKSYSGGMGVICSLFLFFPHVSFSATYYSKVNNGNWTANTSWYTDACGGVTTATAGNYPGSAAGDVAIICSGITILMDNTPTNSIISLTLNGSGILNFSVNSKTLTTTGNVTMNSTSQIIGNNNNRILNIGSSLIVSSGANVNIGGIQVNVTGITTIDGTVNFIDATGTKTFNP